MQGTFANAEYELYLSKEQKWQGDPLSKYYKCKTKEEYVNLLKGQETNLIIKTFFNSLCVFKADNKEFLGVLVLARY